MEGQALDVVSREEAGASLTVVAGDSASSARQIGSASRMILAVEDAFPLPQSVVESLTAAGPDIVRTNSAARAAAVARSIVLDGIVVTLEDSVGDDDAIRPGVAFLLQSPPAFTCPVVLLADHDLTAAEARCVSGLHVLLLRADSLGRRDVRERLARHVVGTTQ